MILDSMARPIRMICIHRIGNTDIEMWFVEIGLHMFSDSMAISIYRYGHAIKKHMYVYIHICAYITVTSLLSIHHPFIIHHPKKKKKKKSSTCSLSYMSDSCYKSKAKANTHDLSMARCHAISATESASPPSKSISVIWYKTVAIFLCVFWHLKCEAVYFLIQVKQFHKVSGKWTLTNFQFANTCHYNLSNTIKSICEVFKPD